jgi:hypothetical protein
VIRWSADGIRYITSRSVRYPGAIDLDPEWTREALADPDLIALEPDPKSRMGASRFVGESPAAGMVLVVIGFRDVHGDLHGINAWPATGPDLALYTAGVTNGEND